MLFVEVRFLVFFAAFFALYWSLRTLRQRLWLILIGSYLFYASWDWRFLSLVLLSTAIDYVAALRIEGASEKATRRNWMLFSVLSNLSILGFFKYFNFFADQLQGIALFMGGAELDPLTVNVILPIGISFYTLQTISYTLDVYSGRSKAQHDPLIVASYVAFFPQLVAGPILRAHEFIPQLLEKKRWADVPVQACLALFLVGFAKKTVIADHIAILVDAVYANPASYHYVDVIGAALMWTLQVYCDFSGYSDIAIGAAGLLGFKLQRNFYMAHLVTSPTEYRRRWHISLTTWLRDYLFKPLGGASTNKWRTYRNIMITNVVSGFWHGAAWTFIGWGFWNGLSVVLHREWHNFMTRHEIHIPFRWLFGFLATTYLTAIACFFFRATELDSVFIMLRVMHGFLPAGDVSLPINPLLVVGVVWFAQWTYHKLRVIDRSEEVSPPLFAVLYGIAITMTFALGSTQARDFVYFQF